MSHLMRGAGPLKVRVADFRPRRDGKTLREGNPRLRGNDESGTEAEIAR